MPLPPPWVGASATPHEVGANATPVLYDGICRERYWWWWWWWWFSGRYSLHWGIPACLDPRIGGKINNDPVCWMVKTMDSCGVSPSKWYEGFEWIWMNSSKKILQHQPFYIIYIIAVNGGAIPNQQSATSTSTIPSRSKSARAYPGALQGLWPTEATWSQRLRSADFEASAVSNAQNQSNQ